jgi:site-specific recombinase XerD
MAVSSVQFFDHVDSFTDYRKTIYQASDQTIRTNYIDLELFEQFVKEQRYQEITGPAVMDFQYYLKKQRANSGASINRKIFTLRSYARFLKLEQVEGADNLPFWDVLKIRSGYRNRPAALNKIQLGSIFGAIDRSNFLGIRDYAVYALMYDLGLRVGEVYSLNIESIDIKSKKVTVTGKGNKRRTLYMNAELISILSEWLAIRHNFLNSEKVNALFISKKGNRMAIRTMEDNLKKIVRKVNLMTHFNVSCHTLRHSFASHLNDNGTDVLVIQSLLGHSSPRSTHPYIHPSEQKIREALEKLPGVIYMNQLMESGKLNLSFQSKYHSRKE